MLLNCDPTDLLAPLPRRLAADAATARVYHECQIKALEGIVYRCELFGDAQILASMYACLMTFRRRQRDAAETD